MNTSSPTAVSRKRVVIAATAGLVVIGLAGGALAYGSGALTMSASPVFVEQSPVIQTSFERITPTATTTSLPDMTPLRGEGGATSLSTTSPDGRTTATVFTDAQGDLGYTVTRDAKTIIRESDLGLVVNGTDIGAGVSLDTAAVTSVDSTYPLIGHHAVGTDRHIASVIPLVADGSSLASVEMRVFDTGIAFRYLLSEQAVGATVSGEHTTIEFDPNATLTYQPVTPSTIDDMQNSFSRGAFSGIGTRQITVLPTVELADGHLANVTEANTRDWPAMALNASGDGTLAPYYWATDNGQGTFQIAAETPRSPFRVITIADSLTALTNSDIVTAVNDPLDTVAFPGGDTSWISTGVTSTNYFVGYDASVTGITALIDAASAANVPGVTIEGNLAHASWGVNTAEKFAKLAELTRAANAKKNPVRVWLWTDYDKGAGADTSFTSGIRYESGSAFPQTSLQNPDFREAYLDLVAAAGVAGLKIDHIGDETESKVNLYGDVNRATAARKLMVIYHNPQAPTGANRTYPNELGREAIKGLQSGSDATQNTLAPFTRLVAGPADYCPMILTRSTGNVTWAHHLASMVSYSMGYLQMAENPANVAPGGQFHDLVGDIVANMPAEWKQSWMLPQSGIGRAAAVVRESNDGEFWVSIVAGADGLGDVRVPLDFLPGGTTFNVDLFTDAATAASMDRVTTTRDATGELAATIGAGGGMLARITTAKINNPADDVNTTFTIAAEADLDLIRMHPSSKFELAADIVLTRPWVPIPAFAGVLDGKGHTISNIEIVASEGEHVSGWNGSKAFIVNNNGTIQRIGFVDAKSTLPTLPTGDQGPILAIVASVNRGVIDQVFTERTVVENGTRAAALVGDNHGTVKNSYAVGSRAVAYWEAGALVSKTYNTGVLTNTYVADADVVASKTAGALGAYGYAGTQVSGNVVISGSVTNPGTNRGRIIARENGRPTYVNNLSADTVTVNGSRVTGGTATNKNGADVTAAQLLNPETYTGIGWDLTDLWDVDTDAGRPLLKAFTEVPNVPTESQQITVDVPEIGPGEFVWSIDGSHRLVDLGETQSSGDRLTAAGMLNPIRVTDTRRGSPAWSLAARTTDFEAAGQKISAQHLGWTPQVLEAGGGAQSGERVQPVLAGGPGLANSAVLGWTAEGHQRGSALLGAEISLEAPIDTISGVYRAKLTLTALG